jgi:single-strand DNA-binding protein
MQALNKVQLIGNVGRDPEARTFNSGNRCVTFSMATSYTLYKSDKKETEWHNIVAWSKLGEICEKFLKKGSKVYVEGRLRTAKWEKDGVLRQRTEIVAQEVMFLDPYKARGDELVGAGDDKDGIDDDSIPF